MERWGALFISQNLGGERIDKIRFNYNTFIILNSDVSKSRHTVFSGHPISVCVHGNRLELNVGWKWEKNMKLSVVKTIMIWHWKSCKHSYSAQSDWNCFLIGYRTCGKGLRCIPWCIIKLVICAQIWRYWYHIRMATLAKRVKTLKDRRVRSFVPSYIFYSRISFRSSRKTSLAACSGCLFPEREREREMFYLTTHSTHFIYGYMALDIWLKTILIVRKETRCRHIGYSYRLTASRLCTIPQTG